MKRTLLPTSSVARKRIKITLNVSLYLAVCLLVAVFSRLTPVRADDNTATQTQELRTVDSSTERHDANVALDAHSTTSLQDAGFDVEFADKYVDYNIMTEDSLVTPVFVEDRIGDYGTRIMALLNDGRINDAIAHLKQKINENLSVRYAWGTISDEFISNQSGLRLPKEDLPLTRYIHLLALAFELKGDYEEAERAYRLVFDANKRDLSWTTARLEYERSLRHDDESYSFHADNAFMIVCDTLQWDYNLSCEKVDDALVYLKEKEAKWKVNPPKMVDPLIFPFFSYDHQSAWFNACDLYRIRIWCARFGRPNLLYIYRIRDKRFTREGRVESIKLIRDSYDSFMRFMEAEYAKAMQDDGKERLSPELSKRTKEEKERFTNTMVILRKIRELPY